MERYTKAKGRAAGKPRNVPVTSPSHATCIHAQGLTIKNGKKERKKCTTCNEWLIKINSGWFCPNPDCEFFHLTLIEKGCV